MKRILSAMLCAIMVLGSLCSCDKKGKVTVEQEGDPVILNFFMPMSIRKNEGANVFLKLIDQYNDSHNDVEIQVEGLSVSDGYNEILEKRLASGEGDDIFVVNADSVKGFVARGYLYDLSELSSYDRLISSAKEQAKTDGVVYTIPLTMSVYGMYVNTDLLSRYDLLPPTDYNSLMHCCEVLKDNGVTPFAINRWPGVTVPVMARGLYKIYQSENYEELVDGLNDGSIKIGDYMLEGFEMFEEFLEKGYYGEGLTKEYVDGIPANSTDLDDFKNQKVAFTFSACGVEKYMISETQGARYEAQGVPVLPDGTVSLPSIADRLCINAQSMHLKEVLDVAEYMTNSTTEELLADGEGTLPSREGQEGVPLGADHIGKLVNLIEKEGQIPIEDMNLHFNYWDTVRSLCLEMIDGMSAQQAAQEYNQIQMEQLDAYKNNNIE